MASFSTSSTDFSGKLERPAERVLSYIENEFLHPSPSGRIRLPTMRQLAEQTGVSTATVQKVFRELTQQGRVLTEVGNGTFLLPQKPSSSRDLVIALNIHPPSPSLIGGEWHTRIYGEMLAESMRSGISVRFRPLPRESSGQTAVESELIDEIAAVDALALLFPSTGCKVTEAYRRAGKPVVSVIAPAMQETANFVSPDFFGFAETIGKGLVECGRRRFVLLLPSPLQERVSSRQWLAGLANGFDLDKHPDVSLRVISAAGFDLEHGRAAMEKILSEAGMNLDAVCSTGDHLAMGAAQALKAHGFSIPRDVSVIGGSGLDLYGCPFPHLTRMRQPLEEIGARLFRMLIQMIHGKTARVSAEYLACSLMGGSTTTEPENRHFGLPTLTADENS